MPLFLARYLLLQFCFMWIWLGIFFLSWLMRCTICCMKFLDCSFCFHELWKISLVLKNKYSDFVVTSNMTILVFGHLQNQDSQCESFLVWNNFKFSRDLLSVLRLIKIVILNHTNCWSAMLMNGIFFTEKLRWSELWTGINDYEAIKVDL